jgi:hypothetical protein
MLIENEKVKKVHLMGGALQTLAGQNQGLKTWRSGSSPCLPASEAWLTNIT